MAFRAEFAPVSQLMNDAIAAHRLPGAVVLIGHEGEIVFRQAFGARKLPGEPGLDGSPAPAEPMTEDTIFDLASLTKSIATTTAVLQLYEQGRVQIDQSLQTYLPGFNPDNDCWPSLSMQMMPSLSMQTTFGEFVDVVTARSAW